MSPLRLCLPFAVCLFLAGALAASDPPPDQSLQGFLDALRPFLIEAVPHPLHQASPGWGNQRVAFHALRWDRLQPHVSKLPKNDGTWRKVRIDTRNWPASLTTKVFDVRQPDAEHLNFKLYFSCQAEVDLEQQVWERGLRLYSASARARLTFSALMDCETTMTLETKSFLPDFVFRLRVARAQTMYQDLVVEHFAGFGGSAAKVLGDLVMDSVHQMKPGLEEKLLERANKAIVKAADTKEMRLSLSKLVEKK